MFMDQKMGRPLDHHTIIPSFVAIRNPTIPKLATYTSPRYKVDTKADLLGFGNAHTVDGQNPGPTRMMIIPLFIRS